MIMANVKSLMKSLGIKSGNEIEFEEYSDVHKSESENPKDPKFEYFKKKILDHLAELEKQENKAVSKSIDIEEWIQKANYPVGTVRTWNGQKFKKITPKKWARVYESESRGAKMAIAALRRKAAACKNSEELYQLCLAHKSRFLDKDKKPLPFMQEFSEYVSGLNDKKEPSTVRPAKKTAKKAATETKKKEEPKASESATSSRAESVKKLVSDKLDEYKKDWYAKSVAESTVRKYGRKKLEQLAALNIKSDDEYKDYLANRVKEVEEKDGDKIEDDTIGNAVWKHVVSSFMKQLATKKLESMNANETMMDAPVDPKDLAEAQNIIGGDVAAILDGRDTFGNKKQTLADKVVRRVRNNPGVARAMLVYIKQEQEKAGKKIFTEKHKIWEYLPKLNEKAVEAAEKGESETKTGVSGALYEGADGTTVVENKDWGRYQISFPGKPDSATISALKSNGFRWSPKTKTWVCYNTANGERGLKNVVEKLGLKKNDGVQKSLLERTRELLKAFGHKDTSKLTKKQITDKNGHKKTVYVKNGEETGKRKDRKPEENNTSKDGRFTVGDVVSFADNGAEKQGKVLGGKGDVVQISGTGDSSGIRYTVKVSDVKEKKQNADGTIPASSFNASDYKKSFTDPKCTNDAEGIKHVYALLGTDGAETQAMVEKKLNEQIRRMKNGDTQIRNMHNLKFDDEGKFVSGEWNPEREKLHNKIIAKILTPEKIKACKPKNGEKPKFVMFGGRGGSGKSWFTDKERAAKDGREVMFDSDKFLILDADELKNHIPEFKGWNAGEVHEESSYLNKKIKGIAMSLGLNIIIDGTMAYNPKKPDKVKNEMLAAKEKGYSLEAHYMFSPIQKSCVNAMNRFKTKKGDYSGRLVPTDILLSMQDNEKSFDSVKDICDDWSFRDNQNFEAKLISRKGL